MSSHIIAIDTDGDTLIILPFVNAADVEADAANEDSIPAAEKLNDDGADSETKVTEVVIEEIFHFKVSMKHLVLACPRAKAVLQGPFKESTPHESDGLLHWELEPVFDPKAFEIVMNIVHARNNELPQEITLELLANIAVIVDDLQCRDSAGFFASWWAEKLAIEPPLEISIDLARIILISSVFGLPELFGSSTLQAILGSTGNMPVFGLPISSDILDAIDDTRNAFMEKKLGRLQGIGRVFENKDYCLSCRAGSLGLLIINMHEHDLPIPFSSEPVSISLRELEKKVKAFTYPPSDYNKICPNEVSICPSLRDEIDHFLKHFYSGIRKPSLR